MRVELQFNRSKHATLIRGSKLVRWGCSRGVTRPPRWFLIGNLLIWICVTAVYRQANNINMLKNGMKIEATHVKKKQLNLYLPPELVQKKKRVRLCPRLTCLEGSGADLSPLGAVFWAEHSGLESQLERRELEADLSRQQPPGQLQRHRHRHALQLPPLQTVQTCFRHGGQVGLLQYWPWGKVKRPFEERLKATLLAARLHL